MGGKRVFFSFVSKEKKQKKIICRGAWVLARGWFVQKGRGDYAAFFWCAGIWVGDKCGFLRGKTSSFSLGKKKQKPERHARFGKSPLSPHFRCGRARSRDVGCRWNGSRPACASPPRNRAKGFACTPLRRRSALAGSWLRGRVCPAWIWKRAGGKWKGLKRVTSCNLFFCN